MGTESPDPFDSIRTLGDIARVHAGLRPDAIALTFEDRKTTYGELDANTSRVANALQAEGVSQGNRIGYLAKNTDCFFEILIGQRLQRGFGIAKAGDELAIGDRANRICADQAQPRNGVTRQAHLDFCPIFDSVPAARRLRLSRCWKISSAASMARCVAQPRLPVRNQTAIGQAMAASMPPTLE